MNTEVSKDMRVKYDKCLFVYAAVLPNRMEHARPLAMSVRRDVWDTYQLR